MPEDIRTVGSRYVYLSIHLTFIGSQVVSGKCMVEESEQ